MKRVLAVVTVMLVVLVLPGRAQETPRPEFDNAPVGDVLVWAQKSLGVGFVYEGRDLVDPATNQPRRVTSKGTNPQTRAERVVLLLELLRRAGLVAFEVGGMPGPTYQLHTGEAAARLAPIVDDPARLAGLYFGALSIRLKRAAPIEVAARVRERLSPGVGRAEVFEATGTLIVTDFADRLAAAWEVARAADVATERAEDLHVAHLAVKSGPAGRHLAALERLRMPGEGWKGAVNEQANVVLLSGRRDELARVEERSGRLDNQPAAGAYVETTQTFKLIFVSAAEASRVLREMFQSQIEAGSVQIGAFDRTKSVVFRGSEFDATRAKETLRTIDVQGAAPRND
ncbi:MAG: hypothetical protein HS108_07045 [Planctomycetes bacterium]|jgi:hypothetical protein|nr:hypothetical protein [Planctomycetota bacterium]MCL4729798.1 hypothetical protein [Planctomycetota bacterium]